MLVKTLCHDYRTCSRRRLGAPSNENWHKALSHMGTVVERGGRFTARVRKSGVAKAKTFGTEKAARDWIAQEERAIVRAVKRGLLSPGRQTLHDLITQYEVALAAKLGKPKRSALDTLRRHLGPIKVIDLTPHHIVDYAKRRAQSVQPCTVNTEVIYLNTVLKYARQVLDYNIPSDTVEAARAKLAPLDILKPSTRRKRRPTDEELLRLFDYFSAKNSKVPMRDIAEFALETCMRLGEIVKVEWRDFGEGELLVRSRKHPRADKRHDDWIPLTDRAVALIEAQPRNSDRIWPYNGSTVSAYWSTAVRDLEIEDLHFHDLRHEGISRLFEIYGLSIPEAASITGHTNWKMLESYTHLKGRRLRDKLRR